MLRWGVAALLVAVYAGCALLYGQKPFEQYHDVAEPYGDFPLPDDWQTPAEFVFARLKYRDVRRFEFGRDLLWSMDYPRGDRHLAFALSRLTSLNARSVEQVVELDGSDDVYNWPFLYAVEAGYLDLSEDQAKQLRDFLERGGFLMVDDFHGDVEWDNFRYNLDLILPGAIIEDLDARDSIFHTVADVEQLIQIPSARYITERITYEAEKPGSAIPHFRAVRDGKGRILIAICHNMDLGDSIEHSDNPEYPERFANVGYRVLMDYAVYALTH